MEILLCNFKLGEKPLIAGVLTDADAVAVKHEAINAVDLIELRIDMFADITLDRIETVFRSVKENLKKPIIATVRDIKEGGQRDIADRSSIYKFIAPLSDIIDVEINSGNLLQEVKNLCRAYKKVLIGSYHNFESTPPDDVLSGIVEKGKDLGVDIVKIAVTAHNSEDLIRLLTFTLKYRDVGLITMSMGDKGLPSRVFSPLFGSLITYGYVTKPSAPGQLSVSELMYIFRRLKIR